MRIFRILSAFILIHGMGQCSLLAQSPPPVSLKGINGTKMNGKWGLQVPGNQATNLGGINALIETGSTNLLANPGFEGSTAASPALNWTLSAGTGSVDTTNYVDDGGKQSLSVSLSSVNGTILQQCVTPTQSSLNFEQGLWVKTALTTVQVCSSVNSVEQQCASAPSTDIFTYVYATAVTTAGQTACVYAKTTSSTSGTVKFDAGYNGVNRGLANMSQASFVGSINYATTASCQWTLTGTSFADFGADTDCPTPTATGSASAPGTKIPAVTFSTLPIGEYLIVASGNMFKNGSNDSPVSYQIGDGTNNSNIVSLNCATGICGTNSQVYRMTYTSPQSSLTFRMRGRVNNASNTVTIDVQSSDFRIDVYRFPTQSQLAVAPNIPTGPTIQKFTSGSGTYTRPNGVSYIRVRMWGGGGGGGGSGTNNGTVGGAGGATTFGTSLLTANGGTGGNLTPGAGGAAGISAPAVGTGIAGNGGSPGGPSSGGTPATFPSGGNGGTGPWGGGPSGGIQGAGGGISASTNSGAGGSGAPGGSSLQGMYGGAGGGSGAYVDAIILNPSATYSYAVGAGGGAGTAGTSGLAGGAGAAGHIEVTEYYGVQPNPLLVNGVQSSSAGVIKIDSANIDFTGSPCTINSQTGGFSSPTHNAFGQCTMTISYASTPHCFCTPTGSNAGAGAACSVVSQSTTTVVVQTNNLDGTLLQGTANVMCMGPKP